MHHWTMEEKIITAIKNIRFKSKQRVTSQRMFLLINKGPQSIECELFQNCMNKIEIDGRIYKKKRGKNALFLINPFSPDSKKNGRSYSVERVHKSPELPKTIEKLESSVDEDLGNIQKATPSIHLKIRPLLYRKDNTCGRSSNICTDHRFFHEEVLFLMKD